MDYFVLKGHDLREPISERRLFAAVERGELSSEDLVRPTNGFLWVPVRRLMPSKTPVPQILMGQAHVAGEASDDARDDRVEGAGAAGIWDYPVRLGLVCLIFACLVLLLSRWPFVLYVPLLLATIVAGGLAMSRARVRAGVLLCAGAILIPAGLWWLLSAVENRAPHQELQPVAAAEEVLPEAIVQPRRVPSTPLPIVQATPLGEPDAEKAVASTSVAPPQAASTAQPPASLPEPAAKPSAPVADARVIPESTPAPLRRRDPVALPQPVQAPDNAAATLRSTEGGPPGAIPSDPDGLRAK